VQGRIIWLFVVRSLRPVRREKVRMRVISFFHSCSMAEFTLTPALSGSTELTEVRRTGRGGNGQMILPWGCVQVFFGAFLTLHDFSILYP
jgi:hypothetical protein